MRVFRTIEFSNSEVCDALRVAAGVEPGTKSEVVFTTRGDGLTPIAHVQVEAVEIEDKPEA